MSITIREVDRSTVRQIKTYGSSFEVRAKLLPAARAGTISYSIVDVPPYIEQYEAEHAEPGHRRRGVGRALLQRAIESTDEIALYWYLTF